MPVTNHSIQTVSYMSDAAAAIGARQLLLTYDNVNPHFFVALQHDWDEPAPPHLRSGSNRWQQREGPVHDSAQLQQFSVSMANEGHMLHKHAEAWLGLAEGYKCWRFLPPSFQPTSNDLAAWANPCAMQHAAVPVGEGCAADWQGPVV